MSLARRDGRIRTRVVLYVKGFPPRETGGPVEVAFHVARELLRGRQVHLTLIVQTDSTEKEIRELLGQGEDLAVHVLPYYPTPRELCALPQILRALSRADVIHFNEFPLRHAPLVVLAKARGVPVVFSLHGLVSREMDTFLGPSYPLTFQGTGVSVRRGVPRPAIGALRRLYRSFSRAWTAVIAPSEALKQEAAALERFPPERIAVIPHGVDAANLAADPLAPHDGPLRLLFIGKLDSIKGPDLLLEALRRLRARGLVLDVSIVGAGSMESELREQAESLAPIRVAFLGVRRGEELAPLYASSDIVVVPSRQETLSLVVLEAMAAGRPIVATNVGGIPETLEQPRNALLVHPDSEALAEGLRRLIEQPQLRASMAVANLSDASRRSWAEVVDRYVRLYRKLLPVTDVADPA